MPAWPAPAMPTTLGGMQGARLAAMRRGHGLRSPRIVVAGVVGVVIVVAGVGAGLVWLRSDGGPPETQALGSVVAERRWTLDLPADGDDGGVDDEHPSVVVDGEGDGDSGTVYVGHRGQLQALDLATGEPLWQTDDVTGECCVDVAGVGTLDAGDGAVAAKVVDPESGDAELSLLDSETGEPRWDGATIDEGVVTVEIAGDVVVVTDHISGGAASGMRAFDLATGEPRWSQPHAVNDACWTGSVLISPWRDRADGNDSAAALATLSTEDGQPQETRAVEGGDGGAVPVPSLTCSAQGVAADAGSIDEGTAQVSLYDPASLEPIGRIPNGGSSRPAVTSLVVELLDEDTTGAEHHTLVGLEAATGQERWRYRTPAEYRSDDLHYQPVGDMVVVANDASADGGDGDERRFTRLVDARGDVVGELDVGIDEPSVLAADPDQSSFVIGDDRQLVGYELTAAG
jgi:outer membrane protein assembly factor BamB